MHPIYLPPWVGICALITIYGILALVLLTIYVGFRSFPRCDQEPDDNDES